MRELVTDERKHVYAVASDANRNARIVLIENGALAIARFYIRKRGPERDMALYREAALKELARAAGKIGRLEAGRTE